LELVSNSELFVRFATGSFLFGECRLPFSNRTFLFAESRFQVVQREFPFVDSYFPFVPGEFPFMDDPFLFPDCDFSFSDREFLLRLASSRGQEVSFAELLGFFWVNLASLEERGGIKSAFLAGNFGWYGYC
jgi:hypothetical protein